MCHTTAVILAAGDGKRMKSDRPKVCCEVLGKPMLSWVTDACQEAGILPENLCVVLSDQPREAKKLVPQGATVAVQQERRGTGHAVMMAETFLKEASARGVGEVVVLCGDAPLVTPAVLEQALAFHRENDFCVTVLSAELADGAGYGRIARNNGTFVRIVEAADATAEELAIREINAGAYWFKISYLLSVLPWLTDQNAQAELYLTDVVELAPRLGGRAGAFVCLDADIARGANDRQQLAELNRAARARVLDALYAQGVDIPLDDGVLIGPDVHVGRDTTILPGTILKGHVTIGAGCVIGPHTTIIDCDIGNGCTIDASRLEKSCVGNGVRIGPFAQLRPDCVVADDVKIGNFVEIKNSTVGKKTSFAHLTYIGDSNFGAGINVGCGVVTVNYDGKGKYRTTVEDNAFIGCNTNLIAPVRVGKGAYVAAATTVIEDVEPDALAIGRVRQIQKPGMALRYRKTH
ncbi:MAG: bifunctional UDP-N-acetylglucosamine diphosphorylase/glucosamine-1-phosphate N-acetyltransferase GlmU [Oscillospiraceae bacterium]